MVMRFNIWLVKYLKFHRNNRNQPRLTQLKNLPVFIMKAWTWWGVCNNSLVRSYISQPCATLVTPDHRALTSQGKATLDRILCPKGPSILSTIELFYGTISDKAKNELGIACGW